MAYKNQQIGQMNYEHFNENYIPHYFKFDKHIMINQLPFVKLYM